MPGGSPSPPPFARLRDYQIRGILWLRERLARHKAVLLCDDPGLGKTVQTLAVAHQMDASRILVICPAGARRVWSQEIAQWVLGWVNRVFLVEPGINLREIALRIADPAPLILVVGYDDLSQSDSRLAHILTRAVWDLLVIDEAHYLKNPSNRTHAVYGTSGDASGVQHSAHHVILLTGTPTPNHAGELYQHMRTFWPQTLMVKRLGRVMNQPEFEDQFTRYRDTVFGRQVSGSKNQAQLRVALQDVILRRRKDQVLPELPTLIVQDVPLQPPPGPLLTGPVRHLAARLDWSLQHADDDALIKALRDPNNQLAGMRRELGELKVDPTVLWVQERMVSASKLLLFAWHHSVIEHLRRRLAGVRSGGDHR